MTVKACGPLVFNHLHPRVLYAKFGWNLAKRFWRRRWNYENLQHCLWHVSLKSMETHYCNILIYQYETISLLWIFNQLVFSPKYLLLRGGHTWRRLRQLVQDTFFILCSRFQNHITSRLQITSPPIANASKYYLWATKT